MFIASTAQSKRPAWVTLLLPFSVVAAFNSTAGDARATPVGDAVTARFTALSAGPDAAKWGKDAAVLVGETHDNHIDAIVQSPPRGLWAPAPAAGANTDNFYVTNFSLPKSCTPSDSNAGICDPDFKLTICTRDADCIVAGHPGKCRNLRAQWTEPYRPDGVALNKQTYSMCVGHSDEELLNTIHDLITSGRTLIDIATLGEIDGRFQAAIRNAITYLGNVRMGAAGVSPKVTVRIMSGWMPSPAGTNAPSSVVNELTRDLRGNAGARVSVYAGYVGHLMGYKPKGPWWNHAKIIAVDGRQALIGGHNWYSDMYLDAKPVHDLSVLVTGSAAGRAHGMANWMWKFVCERNRLRQKYARYQRTSGTDHDVASAVRGRYPTQCPGPDGNGDLAPPAAPAPPTAPVPPAGTTRIIDVGRLGPTANEGYSNHADEAQLAMINAATTDIRMSQQDMFSILSVSRAWRQDVADAIINRLNWAGAGTYPVSVKVIISSSYSNAGDSGFPFKGAFGLLRTARRGYDSHRKGLAGLREYFRTRATALGVPLCRLYKLQLAELRFSTADEYVPGGGTGVAGNQFLGKPGNHPKLIIIDDNAYYVGSHNIYPASLIEYGYIIDGQPETRNIIADYWNLAWANSSRVAIRGDDTQAPCP